MLKLLSISYRLVESWEFPSRSLSGGSAPRIQISPKLSELKTGILLLIKVRRSQIEHFSNLINQPTNHLTLQANQDGADLFPDSSALQLAPYGNYYQSLGADESLRRTYELLACFKKDMHKVRKSV